MKLIFTTLLRGTSIVLLGTLAACGDVSGSDGSSTTSSGSSTASSTDTTSSAAAASTTSGAVTATPSYGIARNSLGYTVTSSSSSSSSSSSGGSSSSSGSSTSSSTSSAMVSAAVSAASVSPNSSPAALLNYVTSLSSAGTRHILIGQHTNYWSLNPMDETQSLIKSTGKTPAILGTTIGCIGSVEDGVTLSNQWLAKGGIVMVNLWATDPVTGVDDNDRNVDFGLLSTPGTLLYNTWMAYLDTIAAKLKAINGPVLFRPFVELNGNWSWFGGKNPAQFIKVYQQMHDYLVKTKGVNNLVWVFSINDGNGNYTSYYPGSDYVDVVGLDSYPPTAYTKTMYNAALTLNKPMIFAEVGVISPNPAPADFAGNNETLLQTIEADFPAAVAVVVWSQNWSLATQNGASAVMNDPSVITLADLP